MVYHRLIRNSHRRCFINIYVKIRRSTPVPESLNRSLLIKGLKAATLLTKRLWYRCFPVNFAHFFYKTAFLKKHIRATASGSFWNFGISLALIFWRK